MLREPYRPKVLIGGLLHERGEITNCYMRHIAALETDGFDTAFFWVVDHPERMAGNWAMQAPAGSTFVYMGDSGPFYRRGYDEAFPWFHRLAWMRNIVRGMALEYGFDALVSIDSDVMVPGDLLRRLSAATETFPPDDGVVAAVVDNGALLDDDVKELGRMRGEVNGPQSGHYNLLDWVRKEGEVAFVVPHLPDGVYGFGTCDVTGAVAWYGRKVLEQARWAWHRSGEDVGFGEQMNAAGYRARYLHLMCDHLMTPARLVAHLEKCSLCHSAESR